MRIMSAFNLRIKFWSLDILFRIPLAFQDMIISGELFIVDR